MMWSAPAFQRIDYSQEDRAMLQLFPHFILAVVIIFRVTIVRLLIRKLIETHLSKCRCVDKLTDWLSFLYITWTKLNRVISDDEDVTIDFPTQA